MGWGECDIRFGGREGGCDDLQADLDLTPREAERGTEPDGARAAGQEQEPTAEGQVDDPVAERGIGGSVATDLEADHKSQPADLADAVVLVGEGLQPVTELPTPAGGVGAIAIPDQIDRRQGRGA